MFKQFLDQISQKIKSRTKEEWIEYIQLQFNNLRTYIQDNGEISFVAAFILGIFVVVFFRFAFAIFFLVALGFGMIWAMADSEIEKRQNQRSDLSKTTTNPDEVNNDQDLNTPIQ